jgi:ApaG protein
MPVRVHALVTLLTHACSYYVPAQSRPELGQFFFAYRVTISNESEDVVMLLSRHWVITDANGKVDHVR